MREVGDVVGDGSDAVRLREAKQVFEGKHLHMLLGTLGDIELGREALDARLGEHGSEFFFGLRSLEVDFRHDMGKVLRDLHSGLSFRSAG